MKFVSVFFVILCACLISCNNKPAKPKSFCSDPCMKDTMKFTLDHPGKPYLYITANSCTPDTVIWSTIYSETNRKMRLSELLDQPVNINKEFVSCFIKDTSFAVLELNDCSTFRGFILKLPFNKKVNISKRTSALTRFDKKYKIGDGLICYADYSFLYVEDILTGKKEQMKFAEKELDIDWNNIHNTFDSVNVTRNRIFLQLKQDNETKPIEKTISL